jgi:hypothetical protein
MADPPRHWRYLPEDLRRREIITAFDLSLLVDRLRRLASRRLARLESS